MFRKSINEFPGTEDSLKKGAKQVVQYLNAIINQNKLSQNNADFIFIHECIRAFYTIAVSARALQKMEDADTDIDQNEIRDVFQRFQGTLEDETKNESFLNLVTACGLIAKNYSSLLRILSRFPNPNPLENASPNDQHFKIKLEMIKPIQHLPKIVLISDRWKSMLVKRKDDIDNTVFIYIQEMLASINTKFLYLASEINHIIKISDTEKESPIGKLFGFFGFQSPSSMTRSTIMERMSKALLQGTLTDKKAPPVVEADFYTRLEGQLNTLEHIPEAPTRDVDPPVFDNALLDKSSELPKPTKDDIDKLCDDLLSGFDNEDEHSKEHIITSNNRKDDRPIEVMFDSLIESYNNNTENSESESGSGSGSEPDPDFTSDKEVETIVQTDTTQNFDLTYSQAGKQFNELNLSFSGSSNSNYVDSSAKQPPHDNVLMNIEEANKIAQEETQNSDFTYSEANQERKDLHLSPSENPGFNIANSSAEQLSHGEINFQGLIDKPSDKKEFQDLADNAWRMLQLLEKYKMDGGQRRDMCQGIIDDLMSEKTEQKAEEVFKIIINDQREGGNNRVGGNWFTPAQYDELYLASLTNEKLLDAAEKEHAINGKHLKKYYCEIEGRLLRSDGIKPEQKTQMENIFCDEKDRKEQVAPNNFRSDIKAKLLEQEVEVIEDIGDISEEDRKEQVPSVKYKYQNTLDAVYQDFKEQTNKIYNLSKDSEKRTVKEIFSNWDLICYNKAEDLSRMINQFLALQKELQKPSIQKCLEMDRIPWKSFLLDVFVGVGCIVLGPIGWLATGIAMFLSYQSKRDMFFTHAPESMKIKPAAEQALIELGEIKPGRSI